MIFDITLRGGSSECAPWPRRVGVVVAALLVSLCFLAPQVHAQDAEGDEPLPLEDEPAVVEGDEADTEGAVLPVVVTEAEEADEGQELPKLVDGIDEVIDDELAVEELPTRTERQKGKELARRKSDVVASRYKIVKTCYWHGIKAYRAGRYSTAIKCCDRALQIDPENLAVQRLKYTAERARQDHRLAIESERDAFIDEEQLAEVERETRFPEDLPLLPRPDLLLREHMPKSAAMRKMTERLNQRVSMNFIDADLDYVLQTLFKISGVDILAEQSVLEEKTLTLHVENVPLKEILDFIKRNYDEIEYTVTENAIWLTSPEKPPMVARSYPLSRGLVSQGGFSTGVRTTTRSGVGGGNNTGRGGSSGLPSAQGIAGMSPGQLSRALGQMTGGGGLGAAASALQQGGGAAGGAAGRGGAGGAGSSSSHLEAVLSWVETWENEWPVGSKWWMDRQTNTLMVLTTQEMHDHVEELLDVMDTVPIQVLVRTKFIEVLSDDLKELGFSSINYTESTFRPLLPGIDAGSLPYEGVMASTANMGGADGGMTIQMGNFLSNGSQIVATLSALEKKQRTRVLSAPQIIAMNNTPASIDISKSFSYASQYQTTNGTIVNNDQSISIPNAMIPSQFEDISIGFFVEFVPSVGRDRKNIVLDLHARVDEIVGNIEDFQNIPIIVPGAEDADGNSTSITGSSTQGVQRPIVDGREFQTRLVVEDGGTVVIGGLLKNFNEKVRRRVPILGQIPILGMLFRYTKDMVKQSNLIIVVQAHIVAPSGQYYTSPRGADEDTEFDVQSFSSRPVRHEWDAPSMLPQVRREILEDGE